MSQLFLAGELKIDRFVPIYVGSLIYKFNEQLHQSKIDEKITFDGYELLTVPFSNLLFSALVMRLNKNYKEKLEKTKRFYLISLNEFHLRSFALVSDGHYRSLRNAILKDQTESTKKIV
jgi:hydroxymethylpyrimidine pyrophosphatase-like HAD family hydrolase